MNSYSNMAMRVLADFRMIRHHENVAGYAQHFDCRAIQPRQYRAGNDFIDSAKRRRAVAEIERAVERGQQWVQLMRAEQDSEMPRLLYAANQRDDVLLMRRVQANQRLNEQKEDGFAEQALPFAAGQFAQRAPRKCACIRLFKRSIHRGALLAAHPRPAPAASVRGARHKIKAA